MEIFFDGEPYRDSFGGDQDGKRFFREAFARDEVTELGFEIWNHLHELATEWLSFEPPTLALMRQEIQYVRFDLDAKVWVLPAAGEEWTHAELTLRWSEPASQAASVVT